MKGSRALLAVSVTVSEIALCGCARRPAGIEALASALGPLRAVEPRLTGGFGFSPCRPERPPAPGLEPLVPRVRCADPAVLAGRAQGELAGIVKQIRRQAAARPSAATLRAEGALDLVLAGDARALGRAVRRLESAWDAAPADGRAASDLAAGYLVRAAARSDPHDLALALVAAEHAVVAAPALPEAQFNRALALEKLNLAEASRAAWTVYLALDPGSPWAEEARGHRAALSRRADDRSDPRQALEAAATRGDRRAVAALVAEHPQAARELVEQQLLGDWAEAYRRGDRPGAARLLDLAHTLAAAVAAAHGERLALDSLALIETAASGRQEPERLQALVRGHRAFALGHGFYLRHQTGRATAALRVALRELRRAGSPMAGQAAFFLACGAFLENRFLEALSRLEELEAEAATRRYPALRANVARMEALSRTAVGRPIQALPAYAGAVALFEQLGERGNAAWTHALLGESLAKLGRRRLAWEHCVRALRGVARVGDLRARFVVYTAAADRAMENGQPEIAIYFRDEVLGSASRGDALLLADAWLWHGLAEDRLGRRGRAWQDLERARRVLDRLDDAAQRRGKLSDIALVEGMILAAEQPRHAVDRLTAALQTYERNQEDVLFSLTAHRLRAQAYRRLGDARRAEADLEAALAAYGRLGEGVEDAAVRQAFREESAQVFDELTALEVDLGHLDRAFDVADGERSRAMPARSVRDSAAAGRRRPAAPARERSIELALLRLLPADTAVVELAQLPDRRLSWVLRRQGSQLVVQRQNGHGRRLEETIGDLRSARTLEEWRLPANALFDQLVRPWLPQAGGARRLVIVPDKHTQGVPFGALLDRRTGRMLLENHAVVIFPSAAFYLRSLEGQIARRGGGASRTLIVGNPDFARDLFPDLAPLGGAEAEARAVAGLYPDPVLLLGKQATRRQFLVEAARARQIELAGHYVLNQENPLRSMLLLAPAPGDSGILYASEIYSLRLDRVDLVALTACATGSASGGEGEGAASLAAAFLAAGVHAVLASVWKVDDEAAARLSIDFHRALRAGADPVQALRQAQLLALHGGARADRTPADWGAFEIIGASAP
jgi:CHAT domain-containing protein